MGGMAGWWGARALAGVVLLALGACGGGGGGGGDASIQVSFQPASVVLVADKGQAGAEQVTMTVTASGITEGNLFFGGDGGDAVLADVLPVFETADSITLRLVGRSDLAPGTYTDRLQLLLCRDPNCTDQYPGSPVVLPIRYEVRPVLEVAPTAQITRLASDAAATLRLPISLPAPGTALLPPVVGASFANVFSAQVEQGQLVVQAGYAPPGNYQAVVELRTADGRYSATTQVSYTVQPALAGSDQLSFSVPIPNLRLAQGTTTSQVVDVVPPNWTPLQATLVGVQAEPDTVARFQVVPLGPGRYEYRFDARGLAAGLYFAQVMYDIGLGFQSAHMVQMQVDPNLQAQAVNVPLGPQTSTAELSGQSEVTLGDGRVLTWQVDPATVPPWLTLAALSGQTGRDSIRFTVNPALLTRYADRAAQMRVTVPDTSVDPAVALVVVLDQLPRLYGSNAPVLELGQPTRVTIQGHFPVDVVANGQLEVLGATGRMRMLNGQLLGEFDNLVAGVPVQLRLRYPTLESTLTIPVLAPATAQATAVFPLAHGQQRPPVYSSRHQSFYFVAEGALQRLANQGGTWVRSTVSAPGALDLALTPDQAQLLVLGPQGISRHDPATLAATGSLVSFAAGTVSAELAQSRNKHLVTTLDGKAIWAVQGARCDAAWTLMPVDAPGAQPETPRGFDCTGTPSLTGLATSRDQRYYMVYQNDPLRQPLVADSLSFDAGLWRSDGARLPALGVASMAWDTPSVLDNEGARVAVSLQGGLVTTFREVTGGFFLQPADRVLAGHGERTGNTANLLTYAYKRGTDAGGHPQALEPLLLNFTLGPQPSGPAATLALPQPVGCLPGLPAGEPCDHRAHVLTDLGGRHVLVLGPQAALVVPLNALVQSPQATRSLLRSRIKRAPARGG